MLYAVKEWADWREQLAAGNVSAPPPAKGFKLDASVAPEPSQPTSESDTVLEYTFVISTSAIDRDRDTIAVDGWDLSNYQHNPVVLWAHRYDDPPIGRSLQLIKSAEHLSSRMTFPAPGTYPFADMIRGLIHSGFVRTCSVGFRPLAWIFNEERRGVDFVAQELLEWSICPVPSNPDAYVQARSLGHDLTPLKDWALQVLDAEAGEPGLWLPKAQAEQVLAALQTSVTVPVAVEIKRGRVLSAENERSLRRAVDAHDDGMKAHRQSLRHYKAAETCMQGAMETMGLTIEEKAALGDAVKHGQTGVQLHKTGMACHRAGMEHLQRVLSSRTETDAAEETAAVEPSPRPLADRDALVAQLRTMLLRIVQALKAPAGAPENLDGMLSDLREALQESVICAADLLSDVTNALYLVRGEEMIADSDEDDATPATAESLLVDACEDSQALLSAIIDAMDEARDLQETLDGMTRVPEDTTGAADAPDLDVEILDMHADITALKGVSPGDASTEKAPEDTAWAAPALKDFTDKSWADLTAAEQNAIAKHYAWANELPPPVFGNLKLPHHEPTGGKIVWRGVVNAAARLPQSSIPEADMAKVQAHLGRHYKAFGRQAPWEKDAALWDEYVQLCAADVDMSLREVEVFARLFQDAEDQGATIHEEEDEEFVVEDDISVTSAVIKTVMAEVHETLNRRRMALTGRLPD